MKLSRLDACQDRKIVRMCRTQTSSHNSQGVVDSRSMRQVWALRHQTGAQYSAVEWTRVRWLFAKLLLQHPSQVPQEWNTWCQLFTKWLEVSAVQDCPVQDSSEVCGLGTKGQGFVVLVDFQLTFIFRVVEVKTANIAFVVLSLTCTSGGIHLQLPCLCFAPIPLFVSLLPALYPLLQIQNMIVHVYHFSVWPMLASQNSWQYQ